ncbi:hypothetical protein ACCD32_09665, partial [Neisseria gonorrhoeae]
NKGSKKMSKYGGEDVIYMNDGVFRNKLAIQDPLKFKKGRKRHFCYFRPKSAFATHYRQFRFGAFTDHSSRTVWQCL